VQLLVCAQLAPLLARCAAGIEGRSARAETLATRAGIFNAATMRNYRTTAAVAHTAAARGAALLEAQRAFGAEMCAVAAAHRARCARDSDVDAPYGDAYDTYDNAPAWRHLALHPASGTPTPVDGALALLRRGFGCALHINAAYRAHWRATAPPGAPTPVTVTELEIATGDALCYAARASVLLAQLAERAPLRAYLAASEALLADMTAGARSFEAALLARAAWCEAALSDGIQPQAHSFADDASTLPYLAPVVALAVPAM
jgi:hypothetical protein